MIDNRRRLIALALAGLAVTGCNKQAAEGNKASGEVLEGTISDSMIATDRTRTEPPLAPRTVKAGDAKGNKGKAPREDASDGDPSAEPSVAPMPEAPAAPKAAASEPAV